MRSRPPEGRSIANIQTQRPGMRPSILAKKQERSRMLIGLIIAEQNSGSLAAQTHHPDVSQFSHTNIEFDNLPMEPLPQEPREE